MPVIPDPRVNPKAMSLFDAMGDEFEETHGTFRKWSKRDYRGLPCDLDDIDIGFDAYEDTFNDY